MADREMIERRIRFRKSTLDKLYDAYEALISGRVKSYMIEDRQLSYLSLPELAEEIRLMESEIDALEAQLSGRKPRRLAGVVPRDI